MKYLFVLGLVISLFTAGPVFAGPAVTFKQSQPVVREVPLNVLRTEVDQTFQSEFKLNRGKNPNEKTNNNTDTWHYEVELAHRIPIEGNWYLKLGIEWKRYDFGNNRSLAPNSLSSYAAEIALEYWVEGDLGFFIETKPGLYVAHDLRWDAFDAPTNVVVAYPVVDQKFYIIAGVTMSLLREYPVLPIGGVLWHIDKKWDLRAYLPEPKLVYKATDKLELWAGGEVTGGAFRNDSRVDAPARQLNHTPVEYFELRGGGGLRYLGWERVEIDFAAGYAFVRKFDFYRPGIVQETQGAPYLKLAAQFDF